MMLSLLHLFNRSQGIEEDNEHVFLPYFLEVSQDLALSLVWGTQGTGEFLRWLHC